MANYTGYSNNCFSSNSPFSFLDNSDFNWESLNPLLANVINNPCLVQNSNMDYQSLMGFCSDQIPINQPSQLQHAKLLEDSIITQPYTASVKDHLSEQFDSSVVLSANGNECSGSINKRKADDLAESSSSLHSFSPKSPNDGVTKKKNNTGRRKRSKNDEKEEGNNKKEVVHVRARRGQATDSHSIAERVRRGKINERLKCLQDIVPGCYKTMGMAVMLDEIINYVQSLQNQVEFLSMKLTAASHFHDFNSEPEHVEKKQVEPCNSNEAQDVERITSKGVYDEALLPNLYQSTWPSF